MPELKLDDTIVAMATASGEAALSIIRLSGPRAFFVADGLFSAKSKKPLRSADSHTVHYGHIKEGRQIVDECMATVFRKPKSFTTEDIIEFSVHGGSHIARKVVQLCVRLGARMAEPGEFTRRAFLHGRIDLTQAEAVADIIQSQSDQSARQALGQLDGGLSKKTGLLKTRLLRILAHIEAYVDFPEDDHDVFTNDEFLSAITDVRSNLEELLSTFQSGKWLRSGLLCAIVGRPNVGKSSLLNALLEEDRAMVTDEPGTTRDTIEESLSWQGVSIKLVDTAGLGAATGRLDRLGMERTEKFFDRADLFLWVFDASGDLTDDDLRVLDHIKSRRFIAVANKADLGVRLVPEKLKTKTNGSAIVECSALKGSGLTELKETIAASVWKNEPACENVHLTRERHRAGVEKTLTHVVRAQKAVGEHTSLEFIASDLRAALRALEELIGEVYDDDILDVIFREFCVGK